MKRIVLRVIVAIGFLKAVGGSWKRLDLWPGNPSTTQNNFLSVEIDSEPCNIRTSVGKVGIPLQTIL